MRTNSLRQTSYGFRPRRGCHDALRGSQRIISEGYIYVVDLERFFDTVSHSKLIEILSRTIKDGRVVSLIHKYLRIGVMNKGLFEASEEGTPQGGPLSPLLSNIMLNELDKELERRGLPFVRYADDSMIFCKSKRAAMRVKESITRFIDKAACCNLGESFNTNLSVDVAYNDATTGARQIKLLGLSGTVGHLRVSNLLISCR